MGRRRRFSEDIDLIQRNPEGIGPTFDRIRERLAWLGTPRTEARAVPKLWFRFTTEAGTVRRSLKIEINTREHFATVVGLPYSIDHPVMTRSFRIPTHPIDEVLWRRRPRNQRDQWRFEGPFAAGGPDVRSEDIPIQTLADALHPADLEVVLAERRKSRPQGLAEGNLRAGPAFAAVLFLVHRSKLLDAETERCAPGCSRPPR